MASDLQSIVEKINNGENFQKVLEDIIEQVVNNDVASNTLLVEATKIEGNIEEVIPPITPAWGQRLAGLLREYTDPKVCEVIKKNKKQYLLYTAPWKMAVKQVRSKLSPEYDVTTIIPANYGQVKKAMKRAESNQIVCVIDVPLNTEISALEIFYIVKNLTPV